MRPDVVFVAVVGEVRYRARIVDAGADPFGLEAGDGRPTEQRGVEHQEVIGLVDLVAIGDGPVADAPGLDCAAPDTAR